MDNLFMNMYQSQGKDFRQLSFNGTLNGAAFQVSILIDQYIKNPQSFCDYLTAHPYFVSKAATVKYVAPASYLDVMQFYICLTLNDATRFIGTIDGYGFDKLGYNIPASNAAVPSRYFISTRHADLSQPPVVLV